MNPTFIAGAVLLSLLAVSAGINILQYDESQDLTVDVATAKANEVTLKGKIEDLNKTVKLVEAQRAEDQDRITELGEKLTYERRKTDEAISKLNSYRSRISKAALAKPGMVGNSATRATNRLFQEFPSASVHGKPDQANRGVPSPASGSDR